MAVKEKSGTENDENRTSGLIDKLVGNLDDAIMSFPG
jgi:hypothetical protein